jgi:LmbE family N-acetylglucosaminyl deacetylase
MTKPWRLLCVFAHPDDESMGMGGTLARYAAEGVETHLVCATRGERGWFGPEEQNPGLGARGQLRERELENQVRELGMKRRASLSLPCRGPFTVHLAWSMGEENWKRISLKALTHKFEN